MSSQPGNAANRVLGSRYELMQEIASGGMGAVYRSFDHQLQKIVAVKVLLKNLSRNKKAFEMLRREAKLCLELTHPNIVRLYNLEIADDEIFLVMEFIDGEDLYEVLRKRRTMSVAEILPLLRALLNGLAAAHAEGVVHLDIKPENLMLKKDGTLKVADFGIARIYSESMDSRLPTSSKRRGSHMAGTMLYMAPEQFVAGSEIGPATDIYSTGCVVYEMLAGLPPFYNDGDVVKRKVEEDVPPLVNLPPGFDEILRKMLARNPEERFQSARAVLNQLTIYEAGARAEAVAAAETQPMSIVSQVAGRSKTTDVTGRNLADTEIDYLERDTTYITESMYLRRRNYMAGILVGVFAAALAIAVWALLPKGTSDVIPKQGAAGVSQEAPGRGRIQAVMKAPPILIPGGTFVMGNKGGYADEKAHSVTLSSFALSRYETTVGQYGECVKAGRCTPPAKAAGCFNIASEKNTLKPVNCVSWNQARQYCLWKQGDLPTEAQWEYAARTSKTYGYPWGNAAPDCTRTVIFDGKKPGCSLNTPWAVGLKKKGNAKRGMADMVGNVSEWIRDWYSPKAYLTKSVTDPAGPSGGTLRVIRGGGYKTPKANRLLKAYSRDKRKPITTSPDLGFRCAFPKKKQQRK